MMAIVVFCLAIRSTVPWFDEIVLADKPLNLLMRGENYGFVSACTYNLLFPLLQTAWFFLFAGSHESTCALTLFFAFLSSLALLHILRRRGLLASTGWQIGFLLLFWCGSPVIWIYTNGRPDTLAMLLTILLADALTPLTADSCERNRKWPFIWSYVLLLSSPSSLTLLAAFGLFLLCTARPTQRREIFCRGIFAALGMFAAFATMLIYYAATKELVTFIGVYFQYNNATGETGSPLLKAIVSAYRISMTPIVLLAAAGLAVLMTKARASRSFWAFLLFTAAIPVIMTPVRYAPYYAWTFYVPAAIILVAALRPAKPHVLLPLLSVLSAAMLFAEYRTRREATTEKRELYARCARLVDENKSVFAPGKDIVVTEDIHELGGGFLYPVLSCGCRLWMRGPHILSIPDDETRVRSCLKAVVSDTNLVERILAFQKFPRQLPDEATVLFASRQSRDRILPILIQKGFKEASPPTPAGEFPCFSRWGRQATEDNAAK